MFLFGYILVFLIGAAVGFCFAANMIVSGLEKSV